ncbi:hypothetical protein M433DRAFT_162035 [Acidomyces richmondensis BFW]|nr:MAG: hypothetical protein FE78DRAFT_345154 [Acidomyces sp. 'richmondensis']KYG50080.1 hypothetical protein M433DRAFT_162035 [Acidomyces richmondensis BFW]
MPLGFLRLNERSQRPNSHINFIQPLPNRGSDTAIAQCFLERIAAQCYPIMKEHGLAIMTLAEHEPNAEFLGRNFNAGEVIELVLKDRRGRWLGFKFVQMVMMHELAHCKQMNHSRSFWAVRNAYAKQMEALWAQRYEGEGMWGRGKNLATGEFVHDAMPIDPQIPEQVCGGTYRRRHRRKRKRGQDGTEEPKLSYTERQQRRIMRKFGSHGEGNALGDDEVVRAALDRASGVRHPGKPRVAGSKRGRELRANAALARVEAARKQQAKAEETGGLDGGEVESETTGSESGWSSGEDIESSEPVILEKKTRWWMKDREDRELVRVCGDEGEEDEGGRQEMDELRLLGGRPAGSPKRASADGADNNSNEVSRDFGTEGGDRQTDSEASVNEEDPGRPSSKKRCSDSARSSNKSSSPRRPPDLANDIPSVKSRAGMFTPAVAVCPICSLENEPSDPTCAACSHVLKPGLIKHHWRCTSDACRGSQYINAADAGRCGVCGATKPMGGTRMTAGVTSAETLRWD